MQAQLSIPTTTGPAWCPIPMTCGSCSWRQRITNSVIGVSRPLVLDCGTTFHLDYGGRDWPSTPSDNLWKLIYLATKVLSDSIEFTGAIKIYLSVYLSIYLSNMHSKSTLFSRNEAKYTCTDSHSITLPQSRLVADCAEAILVFFLLSFNLSPANTTSLLSTLHSGQYLDRHTDRHTETHVHTHRDRQTHTHTHRDRQTHTHTHRDRQTCRETYTTTTTTTV